MTYNLFDMCKIINLNIDSLDYNCKYLPQKAQYTIRSTTLYKYKPPCTSMSTYSTPRKGTIPYYFPYVNLCNEAQSANTLVSNFKTKAKKGTIPYYFTSKTIVSPVSSQARISRSNNFFRKQSKHTKRY